MINKFQKNYPSKYYKYSEILVKVPVYESIELFFYRLLIVEEEIKHDFSDVK